MSIESYAGTAPMVGKDVYIHSSAVIIGDVKLGANSSVWPYVVIRGDVNHIIIGTHTNIQDGSVLHVTHKSPLYSPTGYSLIIDNHVTIGHKALLHGCTVGSKTLIGMGAIVLDGVVIEDEVMLAAGSLVPPNKVLTSGYLYKGSPVQKIRKLTAQERKFLVYSAEHYVDLKNQYL